MKTPNMPGFTAEASLPKTAEHYRLHGTPAPDATDGRIVPQLSFAGGSASMTVSVVIFVSENGRCEAR
jgi:hypothetical protein